MTRFDDAGRALGCPALLALGACTGTTGDRFARGDGEGPGGASAPGPGAVGELCASCHGSFGLGSTLSSGDDNGDFRLDAVAALEMHGDGLEAYMEETTPFAAAEAIVSMNAPDFT